jgi:hypothetical protein
MIDMELKKVIQNTCLSEEELQECCPQVEEHNLKSLSQPERLEPSIDKGMHTSPYYHREIF